MRSLLPLFFPASVTVVGASSRRASLAGAVLRNLVLGGYRGALSAVHPAGGRLLGVPVHTSWHDLQPAPDLAVIGVPPEAAESAVRDLLARGTRAFLVLTAGLGETGERGRDREDALASLCRGAGAVLLGPNCLGLHVVTSRGRLDASFVRDLPPRGDTAIISQSGSIGEWLFSRMTERHLGGALLASVGNEADLGVVDLVQGAARHLPHLRQLWLYLESPPPPDRLARVLAELPAACRVFTIRGAVTPAGRTAPGARRLADRADDDTPAPDTGPGDIPSLTEALDLLEVVDRLPAPSGRRVAIVTNAGGPSVLAADALHEGGLGLPALSAALAHRLAPQLPRGSRPRNPLDLLADAPPELYRDVLRALGDSGEYDAILVVVMHPVVTDGPSLVERIREGTAGGPPSIVVWLGGARGGREEDLLRRAGLPVISDPTRAGRAMATWISR